MAEYIARDALLDDIAAAVDHGGMGRVVGQTLMRYAKRIPAADVVPVVHGRWITTSESDISKTVECSACRYDFYFAKYGQLNIDKMSHCPNCGAKMDGEPCTPSK